MISRNLALIGLILTLATPSIQAMDENTHSTHQNSDLAPLPVEVVISIPDQRLEILKDGMWVERYRVSTSQFGLGDSFGSYKTPLGHLRVCQKIGGDLASGAVIKHRSATGEVLPANARGRDPIVTRIIWLEGLEAQNTHARARGIYIHGTTEESRIGEPASYGCIRMRSTDVINVFETIDVGTPVRIVDERLPKTKRWSAPKTVILAKEEPKSAEPPTKLIVATTKSLPPAAESSSKPAPVAEKLPEKAAPKTQNGRQMTFKSEPLYPTQHQAANALSQSILFHDLER